MQLSLNSQLYIIGYFYFPHKLISHNSLGYHSELENVTVVKNKNGTFSIQPKSGFTAGGYDTTITVRTALGAKDVIADINPRFSTIHNEDRRKCDYSVI